MKRILRRMAPAACGLLMAAAALAQATPESAPAQPEAFRQPPAQASREGVLDLDLGFTYGDAEINGDKVRLRTYNGQLVGPTLVVKPGDTLRVHLTNKLPCPAGRNCQCRPDPCAAGAAATPEHAHNGTGGPPPADSFNSTNLHTHGLHVSPKCNSDNVFVDVEPGCDFRYEIKIPQDHPAGTFWYHPHAHGATAVQVSSGAEGAILIKGEFDEAPGIKEAKDQVFVFQQIPYKCDFKDRKNWKCAPGQTGTVEDFEQQFGVTAWDDSKRFTTINGAVQPLIRMRPGEVQRWRLVHAGVRENLSVAVGIKKDKGKDRFEAESGWLNVVALDGLPTGDVEKTSVVELSPGYRADVLAQAPAQEGTYYLLDEPSSPLLSLLDRLAHPEAVVANEPRKVLAVIQVAGKPCSDAKDPCHASLPDPARLARFRLPSVTDEEIAGRAQQKMSFSIDLLKKPRAFTVCGREFAAAMEPRKLELGKADEWLLHATLIAGHPFHIHVNPFEVIEEKTGRRYWKDTLFLKPGQTVRVRTRYQTFDGDFVLHCHILDHEDQGMMETVRIAPGPQPVEDCPGFKVP